MIGLLRTRCLANMRLAGHTAFCLLHRGTAGAKIDVETPAWVGDHDLLGDDATDIGARGVVDFSFANVPRR